LTPRGERILYPRPLDDRAFFQQQHAILLLLRLKIVRSDECHRPGAADDLDEDHDHIGSSFLLNVPSRAAAEDFSCNEPFTAAGLFKEVRIRCMRRGQWNPAAAPKTAERN